VAAARCARDSAKVRLDGIDDPNGLVMLDSGFGLSSGAVTGRYGVAESIKLKVTDPQAMTRPAEQWCVTRSSG